MEGHLAVEHHQHHAGDGDDRADVHILAQPLIAAAEQLRQQHRQNGAQGHQNTDVGGVGVIQRGVLQEEVEASAGDADENKHQLILPRQPQRLGPQDPQGDVRKPHPQGDDLDGGKIDQQIFGQDKAAAPHQNGDDGEDMAHHF